MAAPPSHGAVVGFFHMEISKQKFLWKQHANKLLRPLEQATVTEITRHEEQATPPMSVHAPPSPPPPPPLAHPPAPAPAPPSTQPKAPQTLQPVTSLTPLTRCLTNWHRVLFANRTNWLQIGLGRIANELMALARAFLMMANTTMTRHLCHITAELINLHKYQAQTTTIRAVPPEDPTTIVGDAQHESVDHSSKSFSAPATEMDGSNNLHNAIQELLHEAIGVEHGLGMLRSRMQRKNAPKSVLDQLLQQLDSLLEKSPLSMELLEIKTDLLMQMACYQQVIHLLSTSRLFSIVHHGKLVLWYAQALNQCGFPKKAIFVLQRHIPLQKPPNKSFHPTSSTAEHFLQQMVTFVDAKEQAEQFTRDNKWREALEQNEICLDRAHDLKLANGERLANLLSERAEMLMKLGRFPQAIQALEQASALQPSNHLIAMRLRNVHALQQTSVLRTKLGLPCTSD